MNRNMNPLERANDHWIYRVPQCSKRELDLSFLNFPGETGAVYSVDLHSYVGLSKDTMFNFYIHNDKIFNKSNDVVTTIKEGSKFIAIKSIII